MAAVDSENRFPDSVINMRPTAHRPVTEAARKMVGCGEAGVGHEKAFQVCFGAVLVDSRVSLGRIGDPIAA